MKKDLWLVNGTHQIDVPTGCSNCGLEFDVSQGEWKLKMAKTGRLPVALPRVNTKLPRLPKLLPGAFRSQRTFPVLTLFGATAERKVEVPRYPSTSRYLLMYTNFKVISSGSWQRYS